MYMDNVKNLPELQHYQYLLGEKITVKEASEPSDYIWENLYTTRTERATRG